MMILFALFAAAAARNGTACTGTNAAKWNIAEATASKEVCMEKCENKTQNIKSTCATGICVLIDADNALDATKVTAEVADKSSVLDRFCKIQNKWCAITASADTADLKTKWGCGEEENCMKADGSAVCEQKAASSPAEKVCMCQKKSGGLSAGAIAGIVIGTIVGVAALSVGGYFLYKHLTKNKDVAKKHKNRSKRV